MFLFPKPSIYKRLTNPNILKLHTMHRLCQEIKCVMGLRGQWKVKLPGNLISMYLNLLHSDQGNYTQNRTTYKGDTVINDPQQSPYSRK